MMKQIRRVTAAVLALCLLANLAACGALDAAKDAANSAVDAAKDAAGSAVNAAKDSAAAWFSSLDFSKFREGWDASVDFMGNQYAAATSGEYIRNVQEALSELKTDIRDAANSAADSAAESVKGTVREAGSLAEKWASDTFRFGSGNGGASGAPGAAEGADAGGENPSLKYYRDAGEDAAAQAKTLLEDYREFCAETADGEPPTLTEYLNQRGYDAETQDALLASVFDGQDRVIPEERLSEAAAYLRGRAGSLSGGQGASAPGRNPSNPSSLSDPSFQETLDRLRRLLEAPEDAASEPLTLEDVQAIAELVQAGEFRPEDFGLTLSSILSPKFILKLAVGTGMDPTLLNLAFTVGPDIFSILKAAAENGALDEAELQTQGVEGAVASSEGFVEGSVCRIITSLCMSGALGDALASADPSLVANLTMLAIEGAVHGYELSQGKITVEEYGNLMADRLLISLLALPTSSLLMAALPASKLFMIAGCLAGGMLACMGYSMAKDAVMDMVDAGGFEAVIPVKATNTVSVARDAIAALDISGRVSGFRDSVISAANDGLIHVRALAGG